MIVIIVVSCKGKAGKEGGEEDITSMATVSASSFIPDNDKKGLKYRPNLVVDRNLATAWGENEVGPGIGEWIGFGFPETVVVTKIGMIPGYDKIGEGKVGDKFYKNLRVKEAKIYFSDGTYEIAAFNDDRKMQYYKFKKPHKTTKVKIFISKVYSEGAKYRDTHISEIEIWGYKK